MRELLSASVAKPFGTLFSVQVTLTIASYAIAVIAPDAAEDIGIPAEWVGYLSSTMYAGAMISGLMAGWATAVLGPTRAFQTMLCFVFAGVLVLIMAHPLLAFLGAALIGVALGPMNPIGSVILVRISPPGWRAFLFSLKQCATPGGGMLAGILLPPLVLLWEWQSALAVLPVAALLMLVPCGIGGLGKSAKKLASDPASNPASDPQDASAAQSTQTAQGTQIAQGTGDLSPATSGLSSIAASIRLALSIRPLRALCFAGMLYSGAQLSVISFLVVYLWRHGGMSPAEAGGIFAFMHFSGIVSRIVLGAIADRQIPAGVILICLAIASAATMILTGLITEDWSRWSVYTLVFFVGASTNGSIGLHFSELARLAPEGRVAEVSGGGQMLTYSGIVLIPFLANALLDSTGSYGLLFTMLAGCHLLAAAILAAGRRGDPGGN